MFDTHCHLNFSRFKTNLEDVVSRAKKEGLEHIIVPGTDLATSQKAVEIAQNYEGIHAAVGIHPHHAKAKENSLRELEKLVQHPKVVAVGEVGLDRHAYLTTRYADYVIDEDFMRLQKELLYAQLELATKYKKAVILHNREAVQETLGVLTAGNRQLTAGRVVFHCCEADNRLLAFAKTHNIFIGVDGDVTYNEKKQEFIRQVPLSMLVLETDSPYLLPEPLRAQKKYPNEPGNIPVILQYVAGLLGVDKDELANTTTNNAKKLFQI